MDPTGQLGQNSQRQEKWKDVLALEVMLDLEDVSPLEDLSAWADVLALLDGLNGSALLGLAL
jgi:hypothetical protein